MERTLVIIPALNEQEALPAVLKELRSAMPELDVLVVDDGSTDDTATVAAGHGVAVASLPFNLGVGAALRTGLKYARYHGYAQAIQLDADGQHDPGQIPKLLDALSEGADMVVGSRFSGPEGHYQVGRVRWRAMRVLRLLLNALSGHDFSDTSSGFRAFGPAAISFFATQYPAEYLTDTVEALLLGCYAGLHVAEVPVTMRQRSGGSPSTRHIRLAYHYLRVMVILLSSASLSGRKRGNV